MVDDKAARRQLINTSRARMFGTNPERVIAFVCECGDDDCIAAVLLTAPEYAERTSGGALLLHQRHAAA